ncbi:hypothetical protein KY329_00105 [Candidatus Woesearchaeota archaeon]|nr:hypothetical protein [Candidatus Woesearchaeota archaeon]
MKKADFLFEVSWEVCNKVGGIYTVITSKAGPAIREYGEGYFLIGPYFPKKAYGVFEEEPIPEVYSAIFEKLKSEGLEIHYGTWLTKGNPKVFLIDFTDFTKNKDGIKTALWDWYQIDSLNTEYFDFDEPIIWSFAVGKLLEELSKIHQGKNIVAQFHEWLCAAGLFYLRHNNLPIATVFTTHATTLGRALAIHDRDLYRDLDSLNPDEEAKKLGPSVFAKYLTEKQAAHNAHVFTTVSEITGIEAEKILGRKPDVLLFNGLDMSKFPTFEESSVRHRFFKQRIKQFLMYNFFPYYTFDLGNTLIYFIAGRYEYRDKGIDVFIKALAKLNDELKQDKSFKKTIVAFFWIPANVKAIHPELLQNRTLFFDVKDSVDDNIDLIKNRVINLLITKSQIDAKTLFGSEFYEELRPKILRIAQSRKGPPPVSTHELYNEGSDQIMRALLDSGLDNSEDDVVKIVYYPIYLTGADGLLDTSYYESMIGSDLGVFPSYYEPWGYTPLEAAALGISSLTTDLAGFGRYICKDCSLETKYPGIFVLPRFQKSNEEITESLVKMMKTFASFSAKERTENKIAAQKIATTCDWNIFFGHYIEAYNLALDRCAP